MRNSTEGVWPCAYRMHVHAFRQERQSQVAPAQLHSLERMGAGQFRLPMVCTGRARSQTLALHGPVRILAEPAGGTGEHLTGLLVCLELPAHPGDGDIGELSTVGVRVGSCVAGTVPRAEEDRYVLKALEIIGGIPHPGLDLAAVDVKRRAVHVLEIRLRRRNQQGT